MKWRALALPLSLGMAGIGAAQPPPAAPPAYEDRVIEGLASVIEDDAAAIPYNPDGWARQMRFETRLGHDAAGFGGRRVTRGVAASGLIETPNYGVLSADVNYADNPAGGSFTVRQRGLRVDGGWTVNNELGTIATPAPSLTRQPSRVFVPGQLIEGISTEWLNPGSGLQLQASSGQPGRIDGTVVGRLRRLSGTLNALSVQRTPGPWAVAARVEQANKVSLNDGPTAAGNSFDAESAQLAVRRQTDDLSLQANLVSTRLSTLGKTRYGLWLDGDLKDGPRSYSAGGFWLESDLTWAGQPMASDTAGVYVRSAWQTRQWSAEGTFDVLRSISSPSRSGVFGTGSGRWRYSRDVTLGAGFSGRTFNGNAANVFGNVRWANAWGNSGLRADVTHELAQRNLRVLTLDHDWPVPVGWALATSLAVGRASTREGGVQTLSAAAAALNAPVTSSLVLRGNLTAERTETGDTRTGINTGLSWRLTPRWTLDGTYNLTRGRTRLNPSIDPLAAPLPIASATTNSRTLFVVLRWEERAGSRSAPLGGRPEDGGGRVEGVVYLDHNRNGTQEASELGAAGVTVMLDGRYTVRTDAQGRFEFPLVAAGERRIEVLNETLPLPWVASTQAPRNVQIRLRDTARLAIPVVRQGAD